MIHDLNCPSPEMCSECGEFPVTDDHDCTEYPVCFNPVIWGISALLWAGIIGLGWWLWRELKIGGWL